MARCLTCGRRYRGPLPRCGHDPFAPEHAAQSGTVAIPAVQLAGYRTGELLGRGGFGAVFAATRESDGRAVAIKTVHRDNAKARERLLLEARALETIAPPHVPEIYETGTLDDGSPYLVIEHLTLPTLDALLAEWDEPPEPDTFLALSEAMLIALEAAHASGFIHRDLKPENIFIQESPPVAMLIDFGIAKDTAAKPSEATGGMALGTPEYMAPEQCEGLPGIDRRADIYAMGVVMYEMLTGRPPFFGSAADVRAAHVGRRPVRPSHVADVPVVFDAIVLCCLAKEPARRFESVAALRHALAEATVHGNVAASRQGEPSRQPRASARSQKQRMGLVFFETDADTGRIKQALTSLGGLLAAVEGRRYVAVFGLESSGNPAQRAFDSAQALLAQELCARALVDYDQVAVRRRPDGTQRVFSAAFAQQERFPRDSDPGGLLFTSAAIEALPELRTIKVREGVLREMSLDADQDATVLQLGTGGLVGRKEPFDALVNSARAALDTRRPTIATVLSDVGHGKSHLCAQVLMHLRRSLPGLHVLHLRAREPLGGENNETLRALLRAALKLPRRAPDDHGHALLAARLGAEIAEEVWPAVALVMGWLSAEATEVRKFRAAPLALRSAATRATGEALRRLAVAGAVCCVVDDAHFADETTLDALEYATLAERDARLWVCILATPSFESARPSWGRRAARAERIELGPLDPESAAELCRRLLRPAENVSQETIQRMVQQTQGNPLLLVELVRGIKRHGLIRRRARGDAWFLAHDELAELPDLPKVEWLAERELATLPSELVAHARLVAQLGGEFMVMEVEGVLGELEAEDLGDVFPLDAMVGIRRLLSHGLLVTHRDGRYGFRHQLIRDYVAQSTPEDLRRQIHQAAFRFYEQADDITQHHRLPRLAQHAAHSGQSRQAAVLYLELAEQAANRHSYVEAELMYSRALSLLPDDDLAGRMRAFNGRGLMRYRLSRFEDALNDLGVARELARQRQDIHAEIEIVLDEATVLDWMMDYRKSKALVEEAQALAPRMSSPLIEARLCLGLGRAYYRFNQWSEAMQLFEQAARQAEALGDPGYETRIIALTLLAVLSTVRHEQDQARATFDRVIPLCEERGDRLHLASAYANRLFLWYSLRDVDRAVQDGLHCLQIGREIGLSELEYLSSYNLAELYYYAGDPGSAAPHLRRALEMEPSNSKRPLSLLLQARLLVLAGDLGQAAEVVARIAAAQESSHRAGDADAMFIEAEEVLYEIAKLATRQAPPEDWHALRERAERIGQWQDVAEIVEIFGLSTWRQGDTAQAVRLLEDALEACKRTPHVIEERIRRELDILRA